MTEPRKYHVLSTFDAHDIVLRSMAGAVSWVIIDDAAALRALEPPMPPVSHVHVGETLKRLDEINLEEAKDVIRRLCDELLFSRVRQQIGPESVTASRSP